MARMRHANPVICAVVALLLSVGLTGCGDTLRSLKEQAAQAAGQAVSVVKSWANDAVGLACHTVMEHMVDEELNGHMEKLKQDCTGPSGVTLQTTQQCVEQGSQALQNVKTAETEQGTQQCIWRVKNFTTYTHDNMQQALAEFKKNLPALKQQVHEAMETITTSLQTQTQAINPTQLYAQQDKISASPSEGTSALWLAGLAGASAVLVSFSALGIRYRRHLGRDSEGSAQLTAHEVNEEAEEALESGLE